MCSEPRRLDLGREKGNHVLLQESVLSLIRCSIGVVEAPLQIIADFKPNRVGSSVPAIFFSIFSDDSGVTSFRGTAEHRSSSFFTCGRHLWLVAITNPSVLKLILKLKGKGHCC